MALGDGIRRNIATVSQLERDQFRDAIIALNQRFFTGLRADFPAGHVSYWFKQDEIHQATHVHGTRAFLAWHRELCNRFEAMLRGVNPKLSLHYWDWNTDPAPLFTATFMGNANGDAGAPWLGAGLYDPNVVDYRDDVFHALNQNPPSYPLHANPADPPKTLTRNKQAGAPPVGTPFWPSDTTLINAGTFQDFDNLMQGPHGQAHGYIGGNLGNPHTSFRDPFVFLLHANIDRLWAMWQTQPGHPERLDPNQVYGTDGLDPAITGPLQPWAGEANWTTTGHWPVRPWYTPENQQVVKNCKDPSVVTPPPYDTNVQPSPWNLQQINLSGLTTGPAAAGNPFASVYNNQWHVAYRDAVGIIWDSWYDGASGNWNLQQINLSGLTTGPAAAGNPFASVYNNQWHVAYRDAAGIIWDSWYDPAGGNWNLQQINLSGLTAGPAAAGDPFASVYNNQWHVAYRDAAGIVWDSWYDPAGGNWNLQQINLSGLTAGPAAAGDPFASVYNNQWHVAYRDNAGIVWDSWYDGAGGNWNLQQINLSGLTAGPAAAGDPFASVYNGQWHVAYRDNAGIVWDSWYDPAGGNWNLQQINGAGLTAGPAAAGDPFASVYNGQWHVAYRDNAGIIWDSWYNGNWNLQQINLSGLTAGPAAAGDPFASVYNGQWHVAYRDNAGIIWDSWY